MAHERNSKEYVKIRKNTYLLLIYYICTHNKIGRNQSSLDKRQRQNVQIFTERTEEVKKAVNKKVNK